MEYTQEDADINEEVGDSKAVGAAAFKLMRRLEGSFDKHDKILGEIHASIIAFGLKLQAGRQLYFGDDTGFHGWITRSRLDTGRVLGAQPERSACMVIAILHEIGYSEEDADHAVAQKLDLTDCKRGRPTDIVKWAREKQPTLFADLRKRAEKRKQRAADAGNDADEGSDPDDALPNLGAKGKRDAGSDLLVDNLRGEITRLRDQVARLTSLLQAHGIDPDEDFESVTRSSLN